MERETEKFSSMSNGVWEPGKGEAAVRRHREGKEGGERGKVDVPRFGVPELVVPLACCERDFGSVDRSDAEVLVVVVELYSTA